MQISNLFLRRHFFQIYNFHFFELIRCLRTTSLNGWPIEVNTPLKEAPSGSPDRGVLAGLQGLAFVAE
jgi:hypothetical protein